jgi:predicted MFS family arabinose efflux permease
MRALFSRAVALPLGVITANQGVLTMGAYSLPVVIPVAAADLGMAPESVGYLVATVYLTAMVTGLSAGRLLASHGATRVFQLLLLLVSVGSLVLTLGTTTTAVLAAMLIGASSGPMNPAGSHVLARVATADIRALVFSLKQCGTPIGGMLAGTLLPALMLAFDWRSAMLAIPAIAVALMLLTPFGALGGPPRRRPDAPAGPSGVLYALRIIATDPGIRAVTLSGFGFAVCQMGLASYVVVFLWRSAGYTPEAAGLVFAVLHFAGIVSRVLLGLVADRILATRWVLVIMGVVMAAALGLIAGISSDWPLAAVYAVVALAGASGNGWVGLYFAELARLADPARVAEVAAGSQFITYLGIVCGPTLFALILGLTGSYAVCFQALAALSLVCGIYLAMAGR